jgi:hypothetical protein
LDLSQSNYYRFSGIQFSKPSRFLEEFGVLESHTEQMALEEEQRPIHSFDYSPKKYEQYKSRESKKPSAPGWSWGPPSIRQGLTSSQPVEVEDQRELTEEDFRDINDNSEKQRYYL